MSLNKVVINDYNGLAWVVQDGDMPGLIEWLNENGAKIQPKPNGLFEKEEIAECGCGCGCGCICDNEEYDDIMDDLYKCALHRRESL